MEVDRQRLRREAPSEVFREHALACFITDLAGLKLRQEIGVDILAWEFDWPHTDTSWPHSTEVPWKELVADAAEGHELRGCVGSRRSHHVGGPEATCTAVTSRKPRPS